MTNQDYSIQQDLREAQEMVDALMRYLPGTELYAHVGGGGLFGGGTMPALTLGALHLRLRRLNALRDQMDGKQQAQLDGIEATHAAAHSEWRVHYEQKLIKEADSRLNMIGQYFKDASEDPKMAANVYKPEQMRRTIVEEIRRVMDEAGIVSAEIDKKIRRTDSQLRVYLPTDTDFAWDAQLQPIYPQDKFWWLYKKPFDRR